jgi:cobalt/nickel transport system permease protein
LSFAEGRRVSGLCNHSLDLTGVAGDPASAIHRLDPRAKILGLVGVTLVSVSTPIRHWPVYAACAAALVAVAIAARIPAATIWRRARVILPPILLVAVFIPFLRGGGATHDLGPFTVSDAGLAVLGAVTAKATIGTVSGVLLGATTSFPAVLRGLEALRVPRLFTVIATFMYRYLFVVVEELHRMRIALAARAYSPSHALQARPIGGAVNALFLRTYARGERVHQAMLSRGYGGAMPELVPLSFRAADAAFLGGLVVTLAGLRVAIGAIA